MNGERRNYRARWLLPVDGEPIENGTLEIEDGRITAVHSTHDPRAEDLGNVALIPGLVNAHTHLEFSDLQQPLNTAPPPPGKPRPLVARLSNEKPATEFTEPFTDWIRAVVAHRNARTSDPWPIIARGLQESTQAGCTTLGEIATTNWPAEPNLPAVPPRLVVFRELLGPLPEHIEPQLEIARRNLMPLSGTASPRAPAKGRPLNLRGLSPHAPYSVHLDLFHKLVELAAEYCAPLAIHLAETEAELDYLKHGGGELARMREDFGIGPEHAVPPGTRPLDYLSPLADLDRALIVHGNYLSENELNFVARHPNLAVVYCPRTHASFGHREHPWRKLLEKGASVAVGTDSRASNPDLSLWRELCFLKARSPDVDPRTLLRLGTLCGARALGLERETGSLTVGKSADLAVVSFDDFRNHDPFARLFDGRHRVIATMRSGRWL